MNLLISFRSELLKTKRTYTWYLCVITAAVTPLLVFFNYQFEAPVEKAKGNPWIHFLPQGAPLMNILILPMFIVLLCTLLPQIEYRNNTWKQVLASPQPKSHIFVSKYLIMVMMIILFLAAYTIFMLCTAVAIEFTDPRFQFHVYAIPWNILATSTTKSFVCVLGLSALQFWLGLRFKNFIVPVATGICLWLAGLMTFEMRLSFGDVFPFTYPIFSSFEKFESKMPVIMSGSFGYCLLFLAIGFVEFRSRKVKE